MILKVLICLIQLNRDFGITNSSKYLNNFQNMLDFSYMKLLGVLFYHNITHEKTITSTK